MTSAFHQGLYLGESLEFICKVRVTILCSPSSFEAEMVTVVQKALALHLAPRSIQLMIITNINSYCVLGARHYDAYQSFHYLCVKCPSTSQCIQLLPMR